MRAHTNRFLPSVSAGLMLFCAASFAFAQDKPAASAPAAPAAAPAAPVVSNGQDSVNELYVSVGKSVVIDVEKPIKRLAVALPDIAQIQPAGRKELVINGKQAGETSLIIWDTDGNRQFFTLIVKPNGPTGNEKLDALKRELRLELPGQDVRTSTEGANIFLRGTVKNLDASDRAVRIAQAFGKVINLLNVEIPKADQQILLKVRFASVDRTKEKQMGMNIVSTAKNATGRITTGQFSAPTITSTTSSSGAATKTVTYTDELNMLGMQIGNLPLDVDIEALLTNSFTSVLAEPNIVATNGKQGSFLAGGEYPFPMVQPSGSGGASVSIMFKEYGVRLNFIPTITPRGTIRLQVAPEVSSLDFGDAITVSGYTVPAISTRKVNTEVELADGQSFILGGLLDNREQETFEKIPFIGDIPVLGKFFQSMQRTKTNTELIVIVTPTLVAPLPANAELPSLHYPGKFLPANSNIPMHQPDGKTAENTPEPTAPTLPVEKLIETMAPETRLNTEGILENTTPATPAQAHPTINNPN